MGESNQTDLRILQERNQFLTAFKNSAGNVSVACKAIARSRQWYYDQIKDKDFKEACHDVEEGEKDFAESLLKKRMPDSDACIIFFLKTKCKDRGYIERGELSHIVAPDTELNLIVNGSKSNLMIEKTQEADQ